jgi:hypothetical protein
VSFAVIVLCVASQLVFFVVSVYFAIDSVRKLLDTPSYKRWCRGCHVSIIGGKKLTKQNGGVVSSIIVFIHIPWKFAN